MLLLRKPCANALLFQAPASRCPLVPQLLVHKRHVAESHPWQLKLLLALQLRLQCVNRRFIQLRRLPPLRFASASVTSRDLDLPEVQDAHVLALRSHVGVNAIPYLGACAHSPAGRRPVIHKDRLRP